MKEQQREAEDVLDLLRGDKVQLERELADLNYRANEGNEPADQKITGNYDELSRKMEVLGRRILDQEEYVKLLRWMRDRASAVCVFVLLICVIGFV